MKRFWEFKAQAQDPRVGELFIYGTISTYKWDESDVTAASFQADLKALGDIHTLNLYINSPGGSVFQGQAIYSIIARARDRDGVTVHTHVDGMAASIASVLALAGTKVHMPRNALMMIHDPWNIVAGNAAELRKAADDLDKIRLSMVEVYLAKAGDKLTPEKLDELMHAETWLTAQECYDYGFCDVLTDAKEVAACADPEIMARYRNVPAAILAPSAPTVPQLTDADRQARLAAVREAHARTKSILEVL